ncbi:MAG: hypothetical protein LBK06_01095, partial [Planctomycetaceae bacterium]|nr:hypothetical protein [Planctomycetaceae bacterium]
MKNNSKLMRTFLTLEEKLDTVFAIDRIALIESEEEEQPYPELEMMHDNLIMVKGYVNFYRRLVGRRIAARESLIHKSNDQAVEDEIQHLRQTIAPLVDRYPEMISPEDRFYEIVPLKDQRKAWTNIFADFPDLLSWRGTFFTTSIVFLFFALFLGVPILGEIAGRIFGISRIMVIEIGGICGLIALISIIFLQIFYYRHRWMYQALTLREIAQKI